MFEYDYVRFNPLILEERGKQGWELVTIYEKVMYFKKKIPVKKVETKKEDTE